MKERLKNAEQEVVEQQLVENKIAKAKVKKADKTPVEKKKGQKVDWKPSSRLPKLNPPKGFVAKWAHNVPERIRQLQDEHWQVANRIEHNMDVPMGDYYKKVNDRPILPSQSTITQNEMIAMLIPEEYADARKEYYRQETEKQTRAKLRPESSGSPLIEAAQVKSTIEIN